MSFLNKLIFGSDSCPEKDTDDRLSAMKKADRIFTFNILTCTLGLLLCMSLLAGATWAWFTGSVTSSSNSIKASNLDISVELMPVSISSGSGEGVAALVPTEVDGILCYDLTAGVKYTVTLTASGTAKSGYCKFYYDSDELFTQQIYTTYAEATATTPEHLTSVSFTLSFTSDTTLRLETMWGSYSGTERDFVNGGDYVDCSASPVVTD